MSRINEFKCDTCNKRAKAKYNGEHWLAPQGWVQLYDDNKADMLDIHMCDVCKPKPRKKKEKAL